VWRRNQLTTNVLSPENTRREIVTGPDTNA
jgi:hypothetical protein